MFSYYSLSRVSFEKALIFRSVNGICVRNVWACLDCVHDQCRGFVAVLFFVLFFGEGLLRANGIVSLSLEKSLLFYVSTTTQAANIRNM